MSLGVSWIMGVYSSVDISIGEFSSECAIGSETLPQVGHWEHDLEGGILVPTAFSLLLSDSIHLPHLCTFLLLPWIKPAMDWTLGHREPSKPLLFWQHWVFCLSAEWLRQWSCSPCSVEYSLSLIPPSFLSLEISYWVHCMTSMLRSLAIHTPDCFTLSYLLIHLPPVSPRWKGLS